jgi:hypothetical protein
MGVVWSDVPDRVTFRESVARLRQSDEASVDVKLNERLIGESGPPLFEVTLTKKLLGQRRTQS